jgi:putative ABC transport system permease protein
MKDVFYLAWRYLTYHRVKSFILVGAIALIVYLPVGLNVLVGQSDEELTARASDTPLVVGARSSPLELVLSSLYFNADTPELTTYAEAERIGETGLANPIPLYVRFRARGQPIVGTTLDYFEFRGLGLADGRTMAVLGECVVGAVAAETLGVGVGDAVVSSPETVFDLAGVYPLKMRVVGVLDRAFTADDEAIFVDLKTAWIIQGLVHGHQDLAAPEAASAVLDRNENRITANASVVQYTEITEENIDSFHSHGDRADYPISAVLAVPHDEKSGVLLMGRYEGEGETARIVRPRIVIDELLGTVFTVRGFVVGALGLVALATLATAALVFLLSLRLRRREIETILKIGGSRVNVGVLFASETVAVLVLGSVVAGVLTLLTSAFGASAIRAFLLG